MTDDGDGVSGADRSGDEGTAPTEGRPGGAGPPVRRLADWDGGRLRGLADEYGTPLYVLDLDRVRANYRRLETAFPDAEILYAAKANALGDALATLLEAGAGAECASAGEVRRALDAGAAGDRIHYTAVNPPAADLDRAVEGWRDHPELTITAGAADTIDRLADRGYDGRLCLRVNPGIGAGHHEKVRTGADATFGIPAARAADVAADAADRGFDVVGIHAHVGSGISADDLEAHRGFVSRVGEIAGDAIDAVGDLEFVDVGGGFGVPYREDEPPLPLETVAAATRDAFAEALPDAEVRLTIEPGRYLVADAGVVLTRANTVKPTPETTVVGVDAGMTTLLRPAIYDAYHPIRNLAPDAAGRETIAQTLTGPICESSDVFCEDRDLPATARGDPLAIGNAGAYGYEMASTYNSRPRPASVVLRGTAGDGTGGTAELARRRETVADLTRLEREAGADDARDGDVSGSDVSYNDVSGDPRRGNDEAAGSDEESDDAERATDGDDSDRHERGVIR